jgi:hypothetical protein
MISEREITRDFFRLMMENISSSPKKPVVLNEQAMGAHILNLYEAHGEPLSMIYDIINAALKGELTEVQEKMDGQNITFSYINGEIQFFSKGTNWKRLQTAVTGERPGNNFQSIKQRYASNPAIMHSFLDAYEVLNEIANQDADLMDRLFQGGRVTVTSLLMHPKNPNTIIYDNPSLMFAEVVAADPEAEVDMQAYREFVNKAENLQSTLSVGTAPLLDFAENTEAKAQIQELESELDGLIDQFNLSRSDSVGDYVYKSVLAELEEFDFIPSNLRTAAVKRLVFGDKQSLSSRMFRNKDSWKRFQQLEQNNTIVLRAISPLEQLLQKLGSYVFRTLEFVLGSDDTESGKDLQSMVRDIETAFKEGRIIADETQTQRIGAALERAMPQLELFEKQVEGIVFSWEGKWYKLTGLFTVINKIRGFFHYGKAPAKVVE